MTIEEIKSLISRYGALARLQDVLDKLEQDREDLKTVLNSPVEGDQVRITSYLWVFSNGKWSSHYFVGEFLPNEFRGIARNQKIIYVEKMGPR